MCVEGLIEHICALRVQIVKAIVIVKAIAIM